MGQTAALVFSMDDGRKKKATKAEWAAVMALLAERDRAAYREIRREAWESVQLPDSSVLQN